MFLFNSRSDGVRSHHDHYGNPWDKNTRRARLAGNLFLVGKLSSLCLQLQAVYHILLRNLAFDISTPMIFAGVAQPIGQTIHVQMFHPLLDGVVQ